MKNGLTTGTVVGRTTGLESFTRTHTKYDIKHTSIEVAVLCYDQLRRCRLVRELDSTRNGLLKGLFPSRMLATSSLCLSPLVSYHHARSSPVPSPYVCSCLSSCSLLMPARWIAV